MSQMMAQMEPALEAMMTRMVQGVEDRLTQRFEAGPSGHAAVPPPATAQTDPLPQSTAPSEQAPRDMVQVLTGARQMGCQVLSTAADPDASRRWLAFMTAAVEDMGLSDAD